LVDPTTFTKRQWSLQSLPAPAAETYTAHATAIPAAKFNKVYLTPFTDGTRSQHHRGVR